MYTLIFNFIDIYTNSYFIKLYCSGFFYNRTSINLFIKNRLDLQMPASYTGILDDSDFQL
jgi:hypothetical protein